MRLPPGDCSRNVAWPSHVIERGIRNLRIAGFEDLPRFVDNMRRMTPATRRRFLRTMAAGASAAAAWSSFERDAALHAQPAAGAIVDWHAHWVGPHVVELLRARESP